MTCKNAAAGQGYRRLFQGFGLKCIVTLRSECSGRYPCRFSYLVQGLCDRRNGNDDQGQNAFHQNVAVVIDDRIESG